METPRWPELPMPEASLTSLLRTTEAIITTLRLLTGQDAKSLSGTKANQFSTHVFVQNDEPKALNVGDLWLCELNAQITFSCWDGNRWVLVANAP